MAWLTDAEEDKRRLSKAVTVELNKVKSGQAFLLNEVMAMGPKSTSERVRVPERYVGNTILTPVSDSDQTHVLVPLTTYRTREHDGFYYKAEAKLSNEELRKALYKDRGETSFSPAQAAKDFLEQGGLELKNKISCSFELDVCNVLQTGVSTRQVLTNTGGQNQGLSSKTTGIAYEQWQKPTVNNTTSWKNYKVDPSEVLRKLVRTIKEKGGAMPKNVYLGYEAADALRSNPKTRDILNILNLAGNRFDQKYYDGVSAEYIGRLAGLELYEYSGSYTEASGTTKYFVDRNAVILTPDKRLKTAQFCFGRVNRTEVSAPVNYFFKPVPNEKMGSIDLVAEACGIPYLVDRKSFLCAKLTGTVISEPDPAPAPTPTPDETPDTTPDG